MNKVLFRALGRGRDINFAREGKGKSSKETFDLLFGLSHQANSFSFPGLEIKLRALDSLNP